jgi:hypothetical protein
MGFTFMTGSVGIIRAIISGLSFPSSTTTCIRVATQITTEGKNGFPDGEESAQLSAIEEDLINGLLDGLFVASVTADGRRDFHMYAHPESDIDQWARRLLGAHPHHDLTFFRNEDPDHRLYDILQRECAAANSDRQTVDALTQNGADLQRKHHLRHYLYFPSADDARAAAADTERNDLTASISEADEGQWCLELSGPGYAGYSAVASDRGYFENVALKHNGDYDGWEAAVEPFEE